MPLSLDQYATDYLPTRGLPWPAMPKVEPVKAKPSLTRLPIKAVMWNVYGTLLAIPGGELKFEAALDFVTDSAFDKTIKEFNMWQSMSRKPGAPSAYMKEVFRKSYETLKITHGGEAPAEKVWEDIVGKLMQKEYKYDAATLGPIGELSRKIAYFYHASIQGTGCYDGVADILRIIADRGIRQGFLADGQCFTMTQLLVGLRKQNPDIEPNAIFPGSLRILSVDHKVRKPAEALFKAALTALAAQKIRPEEALHIGSSLTRDIAPAKKHGLKTALFAGDKDSLQATGDQLKDPVFRPDLLFTHHDQIAEILP